MTNNEAGQPASKKWVYFIAGALTVHAQGDVWRLFLHRVKNSASVIIKSIKGISIANISHHVAYYIWNINIAAGGNFPQDHY